MTAGRDSAAYFLFRLGLAKAARRGARVDRGRTQHREFGVSHKSLFGTLEHIFFADRIWFVPNGRSAGSSNRMEALADRVGPGSKALGRMGFGVDPSGDLSGLLITKI